MDSAMESDTDIELVESTAIDLCKYTTQIANKVYADEPDADQSTSSSNNQTIELDDNPHVAIGIKNKDIIAQFKSGKATLDFEIKPQTHRTWVEFEEHLAFATDHTIKEFELYMASVDSTIKELELYLASVDSAIGVGITHSVISGANVTRVDVCCK